MSTLGQAMADFLQARLAQPSYISTVFTLLSMHTVPEFTMEEERKLKHLIRRNCRRYDYRRVRLSKAAQRKYVRWLRENS